MNYGPALLAAAGRHLGVDEWPGAQHNPVVQGFFAASGHNPDEPDETPWCAAFVGAVCAEVGLPNTGRLNARSYLEWGVPVSLHDAQPGDVVVLWRGSRDGWQGHVGFLVRFDGDSVILRGGNQGNRVSDAPYPLARVLGYRRGAMPAADGRPVIRHGARGPWVRLLQERLAEIGYPPGRLDGIAGDRTRGAVLAFQSDHGLTVTGVVDADTWDRIDSAEARPPRPVDEDTLRDEGSRTIRASDSGRALTAVGVPAATLGVIVDRANEVSDLAERGAGILDTVGAAVRSYWPVIAIVIAGLVLWHLFGTIKRARVDDARSGKHIGR